MKDDEEPQKHLFDAVAAIQELEELLKNDGALTNFVEAISSDL